MSWFIVYLIVILDGVHVGMKVASVLSGLLWATCAFASIVIGNGAAVTENDKKIAIRARKLSKMALVVFIACSFVYVFAPNTKQAAAIYLIPKVVNNEDVQNVSKDGVRLLKEKLNSYLSDFDVVEKSKEHVVD